MEKYTKSETNVLYSHDVDMIDRSMWNTEFLLIYRYRRSAVEYYHKIMENLQDSCSRIIIDQFIYEFRDNIQKDILENQRMLIELLVEEPQVQKRRKELETKYEILDKSNKELRSLY